MRVDDALRAFHILSARYNTQTSWGTSGRHAMLNVNRLPPNVDRLIHRVVRDYFAHSHYPVVHKRFDVVTLWPKFWTIQRTLNPTHFRYLVKRQAVWKNWKAAKAPCYLKYRGRIIIWNGTHRTIISYLLNKPIKARLIDLDRFARDRKHKRAPQQVP